MEAPLAAALAALAKDDVAALSAAVGAGLSIEGFYWHAAQQRSLLQLAALAGAACCAAALLAAGAAVDAPSPSDGNTALHCACSTASSGTARTIALLMKGGASRCALNHARQTPSDLLEQETSQVGPNWAHGAAPAASRSGRLKRRREHRLFVCGRPCRPCCSPARQPAYLPASLEQQSYLSATKLPPRTPPLSALRRWRASSPRRRRPRTATCCGQSTAPTTSACFPSKSTAARAWQSPTTGRSAPSSTPVRLRCRGTAVGAVPPGHRTKCRPVAASDPSCLPTPPAGEKARRRDPRCFKYHGVPCPDFRKVSRAPAGAIAAAQ